MELKANSLTELETEIGEVNRILNNYNSEITTKEKKKTTSTKPLEKPRGLDVDITKVGNKNKEEEK